MTRAFIVFFGLTCLFLGSCTQRMVCPAYQSAFIYDKDELRKKFSYFQEDSTPKIYTASKNKYLVAEPVSYQRKIRSLQTVQMKPVPVHVPDSLSGKKTADSVSMADFERAARSIIDSTMITDVPRPARDTVAEALDSVYVITKDREVRLLKYNTPDSLLYDSVLHKYVPQIPKYYIADVRYNVTQDNYMWYLRDALILPDVRIAKMQQANAGGGGDEKASGKEKRRGLKGLFRKKTEEPVDSTAAQTPAEEEFDFIDEADTVSQAEVPQPGQDVKKPSRREKKPKVKKVKKPRKDKKQPEQPEATPEEKKKEDEDDGF